MISTSRSHYKTLTGVLAGVVFFSALAMGGSVPLLTGEERAWLEANATRLVLADEINYQPFVFLDANDHMTGLASDYMSLLESKLGVHFQRRRFSSLKDIFEKVRSGEVHIVNAITKTPERATFLAFTDPYINVPNVIVVQKERLGRLNENDLSGLRVSLVKEYAVTEYINREVPGLIPDVVPDVLSALLNVSFGRSEAAIIDLASASFLISQKQVTNLRVAGSVNFDILLGIGSPINEPVLSAILQKGCRAISDAERQEILQRWVNISNGIFFADRRFWTVIAAALSILLTILVAILVWNRTLRKRVALRTEALEKKTAALQKSEASLRRAASAGKVGLWDWDIRTGQVVCSHEWTHQIGYEDDELEARYEAWESLLHPEDLERTIKVLKASLVSPGNPYKAEFRLRHKDGSYRWILAVGDVEFDEQGVAVRMLGSHVDITAMKQAEAMKSDLEAQLMQAQKMESVGRLAGGVAHDFNNMLGVILGYSDIAKEQVDLSHPLHAALEEIHKAAERSADLTRQLLTFARKQTVTPEVLDLNSTVGNMLRMLRRLIGENIHLEWQPGPDLWPVRMDPAQIDQMLVNLCVNARDSIGEAGTITISTSNIICGVDRSRHPEHVPGEYVNLTVKDSGAGMDKDTVANIFEPFFTTKASGEGSGLGLPTVYGIVKQNNGFINVRSEPGKGAAFEICLPRHLERSVAGEALKKEKPEPEPDHGTILVVEDEPGVLKMITVMLKMQGYTVLSAASAGDAVLLAKDHAEEIQLLIIDMILPESNGLDLSKKLHSIAPDMQRLFMSGYPANMVAAQGILDESVDYIQKPFSKNALISKVREILAFGGMAQYR